ncbi:AMP-binding protein [Actinomadura keratinilytica]
MGQRGPDPGGRFGGGGLRPAGRRHPGRRRDQRRGSSLTYRALDRRTDQLARALADRGVTAESRVGLLLERSADVVVAMLAVLKAGGAYVPLHTGHPEERLRDILGRSGTTLVLTDRDQPSLAGVATFDPRNLPAGTATGTALPAPPVAAPWRTSCSPRARPASPRASG